MILRNVERRISAAAILLKLAQGSLGKRVSNSIKSSYYRSASILLCTVVEGMTYQIVKKYTTNVGNIIDQATEHIEKHKLSKGIFNTPQDFFIYERRKKDVHIDDEGVGFQKLILYLKDNHVVSAREYGLLNWVRNERNKIHLQGLSYHDVGYTKAKIEKISNAIILTINKLNALP